MVCLTPVRLTQLVIRTLLRLRLRACGIASGTAGQDHHIQAVAAGAGQKTVYLRIISTKQTEGVGTAVPTPSVFMGSRDIVASQPETRQRVDQKQHDHRPGNRVEQSLIFQANQTAVKSEIVL